MKSHSAKLLRRFSRRHPNHSPRRALKTSDTGEIKAATMHEVMPMAGQPSSERLWFFTFGFLS